MADVHLHKEGKDRIVRGGINIPAPSEIVWSVLADYDSLETFIPKHGRKPPALTGEERGSN